MLHNRHGLALLIALMLSILPAHAQYFQGFSVQGYRISSVLPTSFRSVKGSVTATIDFTVTITHPDGKKDHVVRSGVPLSHYLRP